MSIVGTHTYMYTGTTHMYSHNWTHSPTNLQRCIPIQTNQNCEKTSTHKFADSCVQHIHTVTQNTPRQSDIDDPMNHSQLHLKEHTEGHVCKYKHSFRPVGAQWDIHKSMRAHIYADSGQTCTSKALCRLTQNHFRLTSKHTVVTLPCIVTCTHAHIQTHIRIERQQPL